MRRGATTSSCTGAVIFLIALTPPPVAAQARASRALVRYRAALGEVALALPDGPARERVQSAARAIGIEVRDERGSLAAVSLAGTGRERARVALDSLASTIIERTLARVARREEALQSVLRSGPVFNEIGYLLARARRGRPLSEWIFSCILQLLPETGPEHDLVEGMLTIFAPHDEGPPRAEIFDLLLAHVRTTAEWARARP